MIKNLLKGVAARISLLAKGVRVSRKARVRGKGPATNCAKLRLIEDFWRRTMIRQITIINRMSRLLAYLALSFAPLSAHADVTLNGVFTDHMILQRDMPVPVYGTAEPGERVTVAFAGKEKSVVADKDG